MKKLIIALVSTILLMAGVFMAFDNSKVSDLVEYPEEELPQINDKYVKFLIPTGGPLQYNWNTASDINPDDMINICAYNNLLDLPTMPEDRSIMGGAEYEQKHADASKVESAVQRYFNVDSSKLKGSSLYDPATDTYTMMCGFGGGYGMYIMSASQQGDILNIEVGEGSFESDELTLAGHLKVQIISEEEWKYISYEKI